MKSPKNEYHGWLVLDKPLGISSAHAVAKVKRLLKPTKIGHGGTLDPLASGILPLALGEATKAFTFVASNEKSYDFTATWGEARNTDDAEGEVTARSEKRPTEADIKAVLPQFVGTIMQVPPAFSALHIDGKRAYAMARAGEEVNLAARPVVVHALELLSVENGVSASFRVACGKGTYVRAIARDLGEKLGCHAYISALRRTRVGNFTEKGAISLEKLEVLLHSAAPNEWLLPISSVLDDIPALELDSEAALRLGHGNPVNLPPAEALRLPDQTIVQAKCEGRLLAIGEIQNGSLKPVRVFHAGS